MPINEWDSRYATLTGNQRDDPFDVIEEFCKLDHLFWVRRKLYSMLSAAMGSEDWKHDEPIEKSNRMFFFLWLLQLIEAAYLIDEMIKKRHLSYEFNQQASTEGNDG